MGKSKSNYFKPRPLTEDEMAMVRSIVENVDDDEPNYTAAELLGAVSGPSKENGLKVKKSRPDNKHN